MSDVNIIPKLATASEVSTALRISKAKTTLLVKSGDLPAIKIGNRLYFEPEQISAFLKKNSTVNQEIKA